MQMRGVDGPAGETARINRRELSTTAFFFWSECCMAQRVVVRAVALLSAKLSEKRKSSEMIGLSNKHCM